MDYQRIKVRAYYIFLNTGSTDQDKNYFQAEEEEKRLEKLYQVDSYLEAKNRYIMKKAVTPNRKKTPSKMIRIDEDSEF